MKKYHFYNAWFALLLIFLAFPLPVVGNPFYDSLSSSKREEIKIIDDNTVEVGIGPDDRSVSSNILDAVQSIPYVGAGGDPDVVFVNKEKVHHFRRGLYTWDRGGKYRVRLTTKYIREFGNIRIHVPKEGTIFLEEEKSDVRNPTSQYHKDLAKNIREEISIIDENMVEVGIGPDDHSVSSSIIDAIKSIPSVKDGVEPEQVYVNGEPIYHIQKGSYAWDPEGKKEVRLTAKYMRKFGNIQVHIDRAESLLVPIQDPGPSVAMKTPEPETIAKEIPVKISERAPAQESIEPVPVLKEEPFVATQIPEEIKPGIVKGFRLARFGMNEVQLIKAIQSDFGKLENEIEKRKHPKSGQRALAIVSPALDAQNGKAQIFYYLSSRDNTLSKVDVIWGHPDHSTVSHAVLQKSAERFKELFGALVTQPSNNENNNSPYIFYGEDMRGNGIKLKWDKPYDKEFQLLPGSNTTLMLSYYKHDQ